jgi:hypothetical protein
MQLRPTRLKKNSGPPSSAVCCIAGVVDARITSRDLPGGGGCFLRFAPSTRFVCDALISGGEYQGRVRQLPRARGRALWLAPRSHACRASSPSRSTSPPSCSRGRPHRRRHLGVIVDRPSTPRTVTRPSLPLDRRQTIDRHHAACEIANSYSSWVSRDNHRSLKPPAQPGSPWL